MPPCWTPFLVVTSWLNNGSLVGCSLRTCAIATKGHAWTTFCVTKGCLELSPKNGTFSCQIFEGSKKVVKRSSLSLSRWMKKMKMRCESVWMVDASLPEAAFLGRRRSRRSYEERWTIQLWGTANFDRTSSHHLQSFGVFLRFRFFFISSVFNRRKIGGLGFYGCQNPTIDFIRGIPNIQTSNHQPKPPIKSN